MAKSEMNALDLFCGCGGAGMGLHLAGFEVRGVDIRPQPNYPFEFRCGNALDEDLSGYDFVWASPPCQKHCALKHLHPEIERECFIERMREKLLAWGGSFIIENVPGAPLENPVQLCGSSFGIRVRRHRIFESNLPLRGSACNHAAQGHACDVSGTGYRRLTRSPGDKGGRLYAAKNLADARDAIGIPWATRYGISQAVPPAYSEYLGRQVLSMLSSSCHSA